MSLVEMVVCGVAFILTGLFIIGLVKVKKITFTPVELIFLPGFVLANLISYLISRPGDQLFLSTGPTLTDLPILVGFPFSFYSIGPWEGGFYPLGLAVNLLFVFGLGYILAKIRPAVRFASV